MLVRTEAITLRSVDYGETSQIVTLFSRSHGRITVIAKGSRGPRARFGSTLQPMSYCQALFYYRAGRSMHTLTESSHVKPWRNLTRDLDKLGVGLRIVELVNALFLDGESHERLFDQVAEIFARLDAEHERPGNLWPYFQLLLAAELGFEPAFDRSQIEGVTGVGILSLADGRVVNEYQNGCVRVDRAVLRAFAILSRSDLETSMRLRLEPAIEKKLNYLVESYVRYHVERAYPTRAAAIIEQLNK